MKKYHKYQNSGIPFIGDVPSSWMIKKLNYCYNKIGSGCTPKSDNLSYYNGEINWLQTGDLTDGEIHKTSRKVTQLAADNHSALKFYPIDSVVIAMYGATIGKTGILKIPSTTNQACCVLSKPHNTNSLFTFYWLRSMKEYIISLGYGGGQPNISKELISNLRIPLPSLPEQKAIATYLDEKTTLIDALIEKTEKKIELLKEQRTAIINQAITKGLDPKAKMKDSGVEWIGEIPEGWELCKIQRIGTTKNGITKSGEYFGKGNPFCSYGDVYNNYEVPNSLKGLVMSTDEDIENYSLKEGDILFTRTSETIQEIGFASTVMTDIKNAVFAGFLIRLRPAKDMLFKGFSKFLFRSNVPRTYFIKNMNIVTRASLSQELLKNTLVPLPPKEIQISIASYLEEKCGVIDKLNSQYSLTIERLKEYRQALISEVVTGKICVLDEIPTA